MSSWSEIVQLVATRAGQRCEYCRMHQALQGATFHIEHIVPQSRGGTSEPSNLALSCPSCNLHKSDRLQIADPDSNTMVSLFNPRIDSWSDHFRWQEYQLVGLTSVGKATVVALQLNHPRRLLIRRAEELMEMFPPAETGFAPGA